MSRLLRFQPEERLHPRNLLESDRGSQVYEGAPSILDAIHCKRAFPEEEEKNAEFELCLSSSRMSSLIHVTDFLFFINLSSRCDRQPAISQAAAAAIDVTRGSNYKCHKQKQL
eukprot:TRINITY_DN644_c0_g1_i1.p2 TRINITY_DN644_c0_g1~~TRINITY_DN644_c0_g1_i1.p2  ORF type:complete len:113 (-),score=14.40 TRINITY_DN644_c0_g1_i1:424-762(-)